MTLLFAAICTINVVSIFFDFNISYNYCRRHKRGNLDRENQVFVLRFLFLLSHWLAGLYLPEGCYISKNGRNKWLNKKIQQCAIEIDRGIEIHANVAAPCNTRAHEYIATRREIHAHTRALGEYDTKIPIHIEQSCVMNGKIENVSCNVFRSLKGLHQTEIRFLLI